jgi:hypothetical protein
LLLLSGQLAVLHSLNREIGGRMMLRETSDVVRDWLNGQSGAVKW